MVLQNTRGLLAKSLLSSSSGHKLLAVAALAVDPDEVMHAAAVPGHVDEAKAFLECPLLWTTEFHHSRTVATPSQSEGMMSH